MPVRAAAAKAAAAVQRQSKRVPIGPNRTNSRRGVKRIEDEEEEDEEEQDRSLEQVEEVDQTMQEEQEEEEEEEQDDVQDEDEVDDDDQPAPSSSRSFISGRGSKPRYVLVSDHGQTFLAPANRASNYRTLPTRRPKVEMMTDVGTDTIAEMEEEDESQAQTPAPIEDESGMSTPNLDQQRKKRLIKIPLKRGRGRPPKGRSRLQGFEEVEDDLEGENTPDGIEEDGSARPEDTEVANTPAAANEDEENDLDNGAVDAEFATRQTVYIDGREYACIDDELQIDEDEAGNTKIDSRGKLLGGRVFTFPVFQSPERPDPEKWYALSIDAARAAGHRDSFFFYRKNPLLIKLSCTDNEKAWLIANKRLPAHLRTRSVNMVAARNIYKLHGAQIIQSGKHITDDYYEKVARESGKIEGEPATSFQGDDQFNNINDGMMVGNNYLSANATAGNLGYQTPVRSSERKRGELERERDRSRRRPDAFVHATTDLQGNPWFTSFGDSGEAPFERAKAWPTRRANTQRIDLNEGNWMVEMARSVRGMNRELLYGHRERLRAFGRPFEATEGLADEEEEEEEVVEEEKEKGEIEQPDQMEGIEGEKSEIVEEGEEEKIKPKVNKKRKIPSSEALPIGLYEPLTNLPHYPITTQSRWAMFERVNERPILPNRNRIEAKQNVPQTNGNHHIKSEGDVDTSMADISGISEETSSSAVAADRAKDDNHNNQNPILGGGKVGSYAWGVASVEQRIQLPLPPKGKDIRLSAGASIKEMTNM